MTTPLPHIPALTVQRPWAYCITSQHPSGFVAVVRLAGICSQSADSARVVCGCGPWAAAGQHHWQIEHVRLLAQPVGWRGAQKLWWPPQEALELVAAQLPETVPA